MELTVFVEDSVAILAVSSCDYLPNIPNAKYEMQNATCNMQNAKNK